MTKVWIPLPWTCLVDKHFRIEQRPVHNSVFLAATSENRCIQKRLECSVSRDESRNPVIKEGTRMSYQFSGTSSHNFGTIDLEQNEAQNSAY